MRSSCIKKEKLKYSYESQKVIINNKKSIHLKISFDNEDINER